MYLFMFSTEIATKKYNPFMISFHTGNNKCIGVDTDYNNTDTAEHTTTTIVCGLFIAVSLISIV